MGSEHGILQMDNGEKVVQMGFDSDLFIGVPNSNGWKTRHGRSRSHIAWIAGEDGKVFI